MSDTELLAKPNLEAGAPTRRARSADRPALRATRWRRLLAAVADSFCNLFGSGRTMELGRWRRTLLMLLLLLRPPAARFSYGVIENRRH